MPRLVKLRNPDGGVYVAISTYDDVIEKIDPLLWFGSYSMFQLTRMAGYSELEAKIITTSRIHAYLISPCPSFLLELINSSQKNEQEALLRGREISVEDLMTLFLQVGAKGGKFSQYGFCEGGGYLADRAPVMIDATEDDNVKAIGETDLSKAALLHLVENQNRVIAQFVDFDDGRWYCFFRTHRGLSGRESGSHGQHIHFISSAYGVKRDKLVDGFRKGLCPGRGFHVRIIGYPV